LENQNPRKDLDFALQTKKYFSIIRHLHNKGLNPQTKLTIEHVYHANLDQVFGPLKQLKYKSQGLFFILIPKKNLWSCASKFMAPLLSQIMILQYG
jgi:hypothetical protein